MDAIPIRGLLVLTFLLALVSVEAGYWLGKWRSRGDHELEGTASSTVASTLGLLAFTLAFTFAMAAARYDTRKELVLAEANAIGTTYLRALLLPPPHASAVRDQLRQYVDARLAAATSPEQFAEARGRAEQLHGLLWREAVAAASVQDSERTSLFIASLNEVIDLHAKRLTALRNRVPNAIWVFLFLTAVLGMVSMGYHTGLIGSRRTAAVVFLTLAFSGALTLIADLDRPQQGLIRVSQQAMKDLQAGMQADAPAN
ncbi:MAG TPA: hypothetical protein VLD59_07305 [Steroidobacteraceae bacterium]|nr:hypothetical protein [Steroidobacteraceae bacterium]